MGLVALVIVWSAYVAEVYRAGIESIHPSQEAAARSLGLSALPGTALRRNSAGSAARDTAPSQ
jgi:polar amino acid transport system permease protein